MQVGSLFSGIGGLDAGLARAGFRHAFLCEQDAWRRGVLAARFPGVPVYDDVRDVGHREPRGIERRDIELVAREGRPSRHGHTAERDPGSSRRSNASDRVDLLCGGFPCQDLSVAGRRAGLEAGERSSLFFEFMRCADELVRPGGYVLVENVPGLLSSQGGRDFGIVLASLAELGFHDLAWRVLDSRYFGVPQRRRRVFVLGRRASGRRCCEVLLEPEGGGGDPQTGGEAGAGTAFASLSGLGSGGPDDHDAQGSRLVARALTAPKSPRYDGDTETFVVADTLTSGSHPGSNMPGRRREDDTNIVVPISGDASYGEGTAKTLSPDAHGNMRLRDPGLGIGSPGDPAFSITRTQPGAVGTAAAVRRLTPVECERLQGLPDDWTRVPDTAPDSRRYAGLGDAVTANVAEWLGQRLLTIEARYASEQAA